MHSFSKIGTRRLEAYSRSLVMTCSDKHVNTVPRVQLALDDGEGDANASWHWYSVIYTADGSKKLWPCDDV